MGGQSRARAQLREVDPEPETTPATESTRLLGAGTSDDNHESGDAAQLHRSASGEDVWEGYKDFEGLPWWRRPSVFWLLGPYALFTLAFGGVIVPKLNLILTLVCQQHFADRAVADPSQPLVPVRIGGDNPQCNIPEVHEKVSLFILVMNLTTGLLSAYVAPKVGHLSDRYGRTRLMAFASSGGLLGEILTVIIANYPQAIDYRFLILSSIFDGATGSFTAGSILTQSYTSDSTPPSKRSVYIGYVHACLFSGLAFGPILAGYFVKWTGSLISIFYVIVGCHSFYIFFMFFIAPESLSKEKRQVAQEKWAKEKREQAERMGTWLSHVQSVNPFQPLAILWPYGPGTSFRLRLNLLALAICDTVILGSAMASGAVLLLYSEYTYGWGNLESSEFISALSLVRVVTLLGIFPVINYFARIRPAAKRRAQGIFVDDKNGGADRVDVWVIWIALISEIIGCVGYILAPNEGIFFLSGMVTAFGGLGSATIQATITKHVPQQRVGQVLGAIGMLHALYRVVGPVIFNGIYAATVGKFTGAFFVVLASIFGATLLVSFVLKPKVHWDAEDEDEQVEPTNIDETALAANDVEVFANEEDQLLVR